MKRKIVLFVVVIAIAVILGGCAKKKVGNVEFTMEVGDEVIVTATPKLATIPWGPVEFPEIGMHPDGRIFVSWHMGEDIVDDYGTERGWAVSKDGGETWEPFDLAEEPEVEVVMGEKLPSGEYIHYYTSQNVDLDEETYNRLSKLILVDTKLLVKDVPDGIIPKSYRYIVSKNKVSEVKIMETKLDFPDMVTGLYVGRYSYSPFIVPPNTWIRPVVAPDGTLWQALYQRDYDAEKGELKKLFACYFFKSEDQGKSFEYVSKIASDNLDPDIYRLEGYCEPALTVMPDGSMVVLLRTGSFSASYIARSTDGGKTWSEPVEFDYCGVEPQIHTFENGVTVASYGRPGLYVRATGDKSGLKWEEPIEIIPAAEGKDVAELEVNQNNTSCFNTDILPLNDHECLVVYSHVIDKDNAGGGVKTIKVRKITIALEK